MISVNNLTRHFGNRAALQNVTFDIKSGERVAFFGSSGAGKTTLMRVLTAYTPPSEGLATVAGYDIVTQSLDARRRIGYMPQTVPLYSNMTVCDYLDFIAALRKVEGRLGHVDAVLAKAGLTQHGRTLIGKLPKDLRQRVGLAQAIIHSPEILILDEPTAGLAPQHIVEMHNLFRSFGDKYTLLLSTRTLSDAEQLCSRILMLHKGRIVADDTPSHLMARLDGGQRIRLQTSSASGDATRILQGLEGVKKVSSAGVGIFNIECACGLDCRPKVANVVVERGWGLLELHVMDASLEDISLELASTLT